jgi:SMC interacting uncharacterized protein involved in chromosome segregation
MLTDVPSECVFCDVQRLQGPIVKTGAKVSRETFAPVLLRTMAGYAIDGISDRRRAEAATPTMKTAYAQRERHSGL